MSLQKLTIVTLLLVLTLTAACGPSDEELAAMVSTEVERQVALIPPAPQGEQGEQGVQGIQGEPGTDGERGEVGPVGAQGETGPIGLRGPEGPQGERGEMGEEGPVGRQGPRGATGPRGDPAASLVVWEEPPTVSSVGVLTMKVVLMTGQGTDAWFWLPLYNGEGTYLGFIGKPWLANSGNDFVATQYDIVGHSIEVEVGLGGTARTSGLTVCVESEVGLPLTPSNVSVPRHTHTVQLGCHLVE